MSFSWTFASQVILRVAMLSLLCSQNLFSASSPPILKVKQRELEAWPRQGKAHPVFSTCNLPSPAVPDNIPCIIPGLEDREQSYVIWIPGPSKIPVDITQAFAFIDERFRETGSCRDGTYSIAHTERNHRLDQDHSELVLPAPAAGCRYQGKLLCWRPWEFGLYLLEIFTETLPWNWKLNQLYLPSPPPIHLLLVKRSLQ